MLETLLPLGSGLPITTLVPLLVLLGLGLIGWQLVSAQAGRQDVLRRLRIDGEVKAEGGKPRGSPLRRIAHDRAAKTAQEFYARTDPENVARLRLKLIRAGYFEPRAVGAFFVIRFAGALVFCLGAFVFTVYFGGSAETSQRLMHIGAATGLGYFLPGLALSRMVALRTVEYRNGFPDFMDLMIVCADAGMSMEAAIERVSRELAFTYPTLAQNLQLVTIELRAGRNLDDALRSLGDRLSLEEVRSFATLLQQSKELGTSLSGALRVFSDEMRHKRMSKAEEKAHALPAKMSVPVTVCILPVVIMVAITPLIVRMTMLE